MKGLSITTKSEKYHYLEFSSVGDYHAFVEERFTRLRPANRGVWETVNQTTIQRIQNRDPWYGTPVPDSLKELQEHHRFGGMLLLEKVRNRVEKQLSLYLNYLREEVLVKPKVAYNDRNLGLFSFDRAAMGLFYQHPSKDQPPLSRVIHQLKVELKKADLRTTIKSVYSYFEHKESGRPVLRLYIGAGANVTVQGDALFYVGLATAELVDFLELRGVPVEVNVLLGTSFDRNVYLGVVRVKPFERLLDKNQLLLLASDPRYFRYQGFKALVALSDHFGKTIPDSLGRIEESMFRNFIKLYPPGGFVFEQSYSLEAAVREVTRIIEDYEKDKSRPAA